METWIQFTLLLVGIPILCFLSCVAAISYMHQWLKGIAEVFGDNEGLREHVGEVHTTILDVEASVQQLHTKGEEFWKPEK